MKTLFRTGAGMLAALSLAMTPVTASAQAADYDQTVYNMLMDCAALQALFSQAADKQEDKDKALASAVGFMSAAENLSGKEIKDYGTELGPRRDRMLDMLRKDDGTLLRFAKTCAAIERVGRDAVAAENIKK